MTAHIYVEGGGDSKDLIIRCREGFSKLLAACGFAEQRRMPKVVPCGPRNAAYKAFCTAHGLAAAGAYVGLLVDSEDPVANVNDPWAHLLQRDGWARPAGARDEQALLMVTSMETWIVCDRPALSAHYKSQLQQAALPSHINLEFRPRADVLRALEHATRSTRHQYTKGAESFTLLARLDPQTLRQYLPSFARMVTILDRELRR